MSEGQNNIRYSLSEASEATHKSNEEMMYHKPERELEEWEKDVMLTLERERAYANYYANKQKEKNARKLIATIVFVFVAIIIASLLVNSDGEEELNPVSPPKSGSVLIGREYVDESYITVTASKGSSCVVKLKTSSGVTRISFFVRAGETVTVGVPAEKLYVYFASGETWYGMSDLFGKYTSYSMDDELLDFKNYTWEYTLRPVSDGNFSQKPIDADDF